jgi:hypothetical protein
MLGKTLCLIRSYTCPLVGVSVMNHWGILMLTRARNATSMDKERFSMICTTEKMDHSGVKVHVIETMFFLFVLPLNKYII